MIELIDKEFLQKHFSHIYNTWYWRMDQNESRSGEGSTLAWTNPFKASLLKIIKENNIKSILDCSCGDWNWMQHISDQLPNYVGIDIVPEMIQENNRKFANDHIKFECSDMNTYMKRQPNNSFDLVIIRHTMIHLPLQYCTEAATESKRISNYSLLTSFSEPVDNREIYIPYETYRPVFLGKEPFYSILGPPKEILYDSREFPKVEKDYTQVWFYENK